MSKIIKFVLRLVRAISLLKIDSNTRRYIRHNKKYWKNWCVNNSESVILIDFHDMNETVIALSYFSNILARKYNASIRSFSSKRLCHHRAKHNIYRSFNTVDHVVTVLNNKQRCCKSKIVQEILPRIRTKQDVFNLEVLGVWIGIDVYETYLRELSEPTIKLNDERLDKMIDRGVGLVIFWMDFFSKNNVVSVLVSHDCYLEFNVLCKISYINKVPVYLPDCTGATYATEPFSVHSNYRSYKERFASLPFEEQIEARKIAKRQLNRRMNGEIGVDMSYSTASAFSVANEDNVSVLRKSDKIKVLICSHCFYDNPHGLGGMLFVDFYEWLCYLGSIAEQTDYDWYIKIHPDPLPGTLDIVHKLVGIYPRITVIPHATSHKQLVSEGIDYILTAYGTVGIEYPLLGRQVINAGFNSRSSFEFNWNPKDLDEYERWLLNLDSLHLDINLDDVYECYFMSHYYEKVDDLIFESHRQLLKDLSLKQRRGTEPFGYFIDKFDGRKHMRIISIYQDFITSKKRHLFSRGPEND